MSKLEILINRPLVPFDPANKNHRKWFSNFRKYGGWGQCPVRFICLDEYGLNLVAQIQRQLVDYYLQREFKDGPFFEGRIVK